MFKQTLLSKAKRNRVLIDYAPQYDKHYNKKKRITVSSIIKWFSFISLLVLCTLYMFSTQASSYNNYSTLDDIDSGQLLFESAETIKNHTKEKTLYQPALLLNSAASFDINGILATVTVTQSFINTGDEHVNGLYAFPLPENSAVNYLKIQIGNREIEGKILEKNIAKKLFNQAKASGKKASLVEQHRPNLFTNKIANIAPNEQLTVTLKYVQHVDYSHGEFSLRFPMSITPRYTPMSYQSKGVSIPNKSISAPTQLKRLNKKGINLRITLNAGMPLETIESPSHMLKIDNKKLSNRFNINNIHALNEQPIKISVGHVQVPMDKDFILQWRPSASSNPQLSLLNQTLNGEEYTLAMLLPPTNNSLNNEGDVSSTFARDITFIIDTSGSMQGESIKQAKQSLRFAINTLSPQDSFNIIAFASSSQNLFNQTQMATPESISKALLFITQLSANGGTEMYPPLKAALTMQQSNKQHSKAIKQILFITDGAVTNELSLFKLIKNTHELPRLFTVGIGSAPNGFFMRKAAEFGQGSYTFIGNVNEVEKNMSILLDKISRTALTNIKAQFHPLHVGNIEQYPQNIPDLYPNEPLIIVFKTAQKPTSIQMFGDLYNEGWQQEIDLSTSNAQQEKTGITSIWARAKIEDLLDGLITGQQPSVVKKGVVETSLKHQVISPYTSFIAIEKEVLDANELKEEKLLKIKQQSNKLIKTKKNIKQLTASNTLQTAVFPKTAVGWKAQLILGLMLLALCFICLVALNKKAYVAH